MRKTGSEAAAYMQGLSRSGATGVEGMCLRTCRLAWGLPPDEPSAIKEWESIPERFRHKDPMTAPVGAPHFWRVGKHGHVAIQAAHEGYVWTTDLPAANRVGLVDILMVTTKWRAQYLGWSSQLNNRRLPLGEEAPKAEPVAKPATAAKKTAAKPKGA